MIAEIAVFRRPTDSRRRGLQPACRVGVLLPDLYTRLHAASKAGTVGAGFCSARLALFRPTAPRLRAALGMAFLVLTSPIAAHLLARAAYLAGEKPSNTTIEQMSERLNRSNIL